MAIDISHARPTELEAVRSLLGQLAAHDSALDEVLNRAYAESPLFTAEISQRIATGYAALARLHGEPVGVATGTITTPPAAAIISAEMLMLYVVPDARHQGVGRRLVEHFIAWAKDKGAGMMAVTTYLDDNEDALAFYDRVGMQQKMVILRKTI